MRINLRGGFTLIDEADWYRVAGKHLNFDGRGYVQIYVDRHRVLLHRFLLDDPPGFVDHINRVRHDNRRSNLRVVDRRLNAVNSVRTPGPSGARGVSPAASRKHPWQAQIKVGQRQIYLGVFPTVEAAGEARRQAELQYFGELCPEIEDLDAPHKGNSIRRPAPAKQKAKSR